jgi:hypothetical protein
MRKTANRRPQQRLNRCDRLRHRGAVPHSYALAGEQLLSGLGRGLEQQGPAGLEGLGGLRQAAKAALAWDRKAVRG